MYPIVIVTVYYNTVHNVASRRKKSDLDLAQGDGRRAELWLEGRGRRQGAGDRVAKAEARLLLGDAAGAKRLENAAHPATDGRAALARGRALGDWAIPARSARSSERWCSTSREPAKRSRRRWLSCPQTAELVPAFDPLWTPRASKTSRAGGRRSPGRRALEMRLEGHSATPSKAAIGPRPSRSSRRRSRIATPSRWIRRSPCSAETPTPSSPTHATWPSPLAPVRPDAPSSTRSSTSANHVSRRGPMHEPRSWRGNGSRRTGRPPGATSWRGSTKRRTPPESGASPRASATLPPSARVHCAWRSLASSTPARARSSMRSSARTLPPRACSRRQRRSTTCDGRPDPIARVLFTPGTSPASASCRCPMRRAPLASLDAETMRTTSGPGRAPHAPAVPGAGRDPRHAGLQRARRPPHGRRAQRLRGGRRGLWLLDATQPLKQSERRVLEEASSAKLPVQMLVNKADRLGRRTSRA